MIADDGAFRGAKILLFFGPRILLVRRDPYPWIVWPGRLDLPGGGRDGAEDPEACVIRETKEEIGLSLNPSSFAWRQSRKDASGFHWTFAAHIPERCASKIILGSEGTGWTLMLPTVLLGRQDAIPHQQMMLRHYMTEAGISP